MSGITLQLNCSDCHAAHSLIPFRIHTSELCCTTPAPCLSPVARAYNTIPLGTNIPAAGAGMLILPTSFRKTGALICWWEIRRGSRSNGTKDTCCRLRAHFQFHNELQLFSQVHHVTKLSVNIYGPMLKNPGYGHIANLFAAQTIEQCMSHPGGAAVRGGYVLRSIR